MILAVSLALLPHVAQTTPAVDILHSVELAPITVSLPDTLRVLIGDKFAPLVLGWDLQSKRGVAVADVAGRGRFYGLPNVADLVTGQLRGGTLTRTITGEARATHEVEALGMPLSDRRGEERRDEVGSFNQHEGQWLPQHSKMGWILLVDGSTLGVGPIDGEGRLLRYLGPSEGPRKLWLAACRFDPQRGYVSTPTVTTRLSQRERIAAILPEARSFLIRTYTPSNTVKPEDKDILIRAYRFDGREVRELTALEDSFAGARIRGAGVAVSSNFDLLPDKQVPYFAFADRDWVAVAGRGHLYLANASGDGPARLVNPRQNTMLEGPPLATHTPVLFRSGRNLYLQLRHAAHNGMGTLVPVTYLLRPGSSETDYGGFFPFDLHSPGVESGTWFAKDLRDGKHVVLRIRD